MYYKPTPLFSSKFGVWMLLYGKSHCKPMMYYKPIHLFRVDVRKNAHGLMIPTIGTCKQELMSTAKWREGVFNCAYRAADGIV